MLIKRLCIHYLLPALLEGGKELPFLERHTTRTTTIIRIPQNRSMMRIGIIIITDTGTAGGGGGIVGVALGVPREHIIIIVLVWNDIATLTSRTHVKCDISSHC